MHHVIKEITSQANPSVKRWKTLLTGRGIAKNNLAIVSGKRIVTEVVASHYELIQSCLISSQTGEVLPELPAGVKIYRLAGQIFREIDCFGTGFPLLIVRRQEIEPFPSSGVRTPLILLVPFQDPSNLGAVIRSAAAFGVTNIVLLAEAASPYHPKSIRASGGAVFNVRFYRGPSIREVDIPGVPIVGLSKDGVPLESYTFPNQCALLPGIEGPGLPDLPGIRDTVAIPMSPGVESLNAAVATSIALYAWRLKRKGRSRPARSR